MYDLHLPLQCEAPTYCHPAYLKYSLHRCSSQPLISSWQKGHSIMVFLPLAGVAQFILWRYREVAPGTPDVSINPCPALVADIPFIVPSGLVARDKPAEHADYQCRFLSRYTTQSIQRILRWSVALNDFPHFTHVLVMPCFSSFSFCVLM